MYTAYDASGHGSLVVRQSDLNTRPGFISAIPALRLFQAPN